MRLVITVGFVPGLGLADSRGVPATPLRSGVPSSAWSYVGWLQYLEHARHSRERVCGLFVAAQAVPTSRRGRWA